MMRVPGGDGPFIFGDWIKALQTKWPKTALDGAAGSPPDSIWILRREQIWPEDVAPTWYLRDSDGVLTIVGAPETHGEAPPPQRVLTIFDLLS
jgi:hypothetical protein